MDLGFILLAVGIVLVVAGTVVLFFRGTKSREVVQVVNGKPVYRANFTLGLTAHPEMKTGVEVYSAQLKNFPGVQGVAVLGSEVYVQFTDRPSSKVIKEVNTFWERLP